MDQQDERKNTVKHVFFGLILLSSLFCYFFLFNVVLPSESVLPLFSLSYSGSESSVSPPIKLWSSSTPRSWVVMIVPSIMFDKKLFSISDCTQNDIPYALVRATSKIPASGRH